MMNQPRLSALDAMRGLAIFAMVLVNNPGSWQTIYAPFKHAAWHGLTPTDVIFPGFIFVMGITIALHLPKELNQFRHHREVMLKASRRAVILILLGWLLQLFWFNTNDPDFNWVEERLLSLRFAGVLPRLGVVYWLAVMTILVFSFRRAGIAAIVLVLGYWGMMEFIPYRNDAGDVFLGRWDFGNSLAAFIDDSLFGRNHVYYSEATPFAFDPEGLLSTLGALATCLSGVWVGRYVLVEQRCPAKLMTLSLAAICSGYALAAVNPVNKALWSPTFVMITSGVLTILFWLFVLHEKRRGPLGKGHPLLVAGTNSIAFFMLSGVAARLLLMLKVDGVSIKRWSFYLAEQVSLSAEMASLLVALTFTLICYYPIKLMYNNHFFWRV